MSRASDITFDAVLYIAMHLREANKREIFPLRASDSAYALAWEVHSVLNSRGRGQIAWHNGKPAVLVGVYEPWPTVWGLMMFGTDDFARGAIPALRWLQHTMRDLVDNHGARRLQSETRDGDEEAERFFLRLGARKEGPPMRGYGKDGEAYQRYAWLVHENDQFMHGRKQHVLSAEDA